ncbi:MAG: MFS transporter [Bacteroidota bacterium]|nr:MFS transporter [Bacteroidota bacterium]
MPVEQCVEISSVGIKQKIAGFVLLTFIGYFCIGLPLAVLPIYIHKTLGYSELTTGVVISLQYITTLLMRGYSGKIVDTRGPKLIVKLSMSGFALSGLLLLISFYYQSIPALSLLMLIITRLLTGCAEGMIGASPINWAMLTLGDKHTATAISFNGIASYGALAVGAPLGVVCVQYGSLYTIAFITFLVGLIGWLYASSKKAVKPNKNKGDSTSFFNVLRIVAPFGICLGLSAIGFGGISNFITLYYDYFHWTNAALCLTVFSVLFIFGRLFFAKHIDIKGGLQVGLICFITELAGLIILFMASNSTLALLGSGITGFGFSLVFPALGVEAVRSAPSANAGAALAGYGLFIDLSLGVTGPMIGGVIHYAGMPWLFAFCALAMLSGLILLLSIMSKRESVSTSLC